MIAMVQDMSIARWMIAATAFAALLAMSAVAIERWQRLAGRSTRNIWALTLAIATLWPIAALFVLTQPADQFTADRAATVSVGVVAIDAPQHASLVDRVIGWWSSNGDATLLLGWAVLSGVLLLQLLRALHTLHRAASQADSMELLGESVLVSEAIGPAVFGVWRPRVVVPRWVLDLDEPLQALVLRHEREHREGRDSWLVWLALTTTTLMPWNIAVWFMAHRLRLAMEVDCDARTLRAFPDRKTAYARLLLFIAQRATPVRVAPALAHLPSHLARRISAMTNAPSARPMLQRAAAVAVVLASVVAACSRQVAGNLAGPATPQPSAAASTPIAATPSPASTPVATPRAAAATLSPADSAARANLPWFDFQVDQPAKMKGDAKGPRYPEELRQARIEGNVLAQFVVLTDGRVDMSTLKVLKTDNDAFSASLRETLAQLEYEPARVKGRAVKQVVQQMFAWRLSKPDERLR